MEWNRYVSIGVIFLLLISGMAVFLFNTDSNTDIRGSIIGDHIQTIEYDESVTYKILVKNEGNYNAVIDLRIDGVPELWSASLDEDFFLLDKECHKIVTLSVNAPSVELEGTRDLDTLANVVVRGENVTCGTFTQLIGTVTHKRNGTVITSDDEVCCGDLFSTTSRSIIRLKICCWLITIEFENRDIEIIIGPTLLIYPPPCPTVTIIDHGPIDPSKPSFLSVSFAWIPNCVIIMRNRAEDIIPSLDFRKNETLLSQSSQSDYLAALTVPSGQSERLIFSSKYSNGKSTIDLFDGDLEITTDVESTQLNEYEQVIVNRTENIPDPITIDRIMIVLESADTVEGLLTSDGTNITEFDDTNYFNLQSEQIFFMPVSFTNLKLDIDGRLEGPYKVSYSTIQGNTIRTFTVQTMSKETTKETFVFEEDKIELQDFEGDKTYNLFISVVGTISGEVKEFELENVKTSVDDQSFAVKDWDKINDENEKPVTMTEGDVEIDVSTGTRAEKIEDEIEEAKKEEFEEWPLLMVGIFIIILLVIIGFSYLMHGESVGEIKIDKIEIDPKEPLKGNQSEIRVRIINPGPVLKGVMNQVTLSFYDDYEVIEEKELDLRKSNFQTESERVISCQWTPEVPGIHAINVAVDINDTESDLDSIQVLVKDIDE